MSRGSPGCHIHDSSLAVTTPDGTKTLTIANRIIAGGEWEVSLLGGGGGYTHIPIRQATSITLGAPVTLSAAQNAFTYRTLTVIDGQGTHTYDLPTSSFLGVEAYDPNQDWVKFRVGDITAFTFTLAP